MDECCGHSKICANCGHPTSPSLLQRPQVNNQKWLSNLRAGHLPPDADRATLEKELEALRAAADAHERGLDRIRARMASIEADVDRWSCFLHSPIRRMPDEVMEDILLWTWIASNAHASRGIPIRKSHLQSAEDLPALWPSRVYAPPHVCAWWRRLVLNRPAPHPYYELTTRDIVDFRKDNSARGWCYAFPDNLGPTLARLPYPDLNIRIDNTKHGGRIFPTLDETNVHPERWRCAVLENVPCWIMQEVGEQHLPSLRYLHMSLGHDAEQDIGPALSVQDRSLLLRNAPQLHSISLMKKQGLQMQCLPVTLPWSQLREARLSNIPLAVSLEILAECKFLGSFVWWDERTANEVDLQDIIPSGRVVSDSVTELSVALEGLENTSLGNLLRWATMPSLANIEVAYAPTGLLVSFIKQSGCRLTTLSLHASIYTMSSEDFPVIFDAVPELERLSFLYDTYFEDDWMPQYEGETMSLFLHALSTSLYHVQPHPSTAYRYLPRLNTLFFRCPERCDTSFLAMISLRGRSRRPDPHNLAKTAPLREVWLETPLNQEDAVWMRELSLAQGFELYGLNTCGAMYDALLPHDWKPPLEVSRCALIGTRALLLLTCIHSSQTRQTECRPREHLSL
ncbi:hypothetical protein K523DRAFT_304487 [Schizophyllum commune Tattone D]|nr:hypothetical protein K523DRAFT_304487 [Schizophyllum commune Tattone D]